MVFIPYHVFLLCLSREKNMFFSTGRRPSLAGPPLGARSSHLGCRRILQPGRSSPLGKSMVLWLLKIHGFYEKYAKTWDISHRGPKLGISPIEDPYIQIPVSKKIWILWVPHRHRLQIKVPQAACHGQHAPHATKGYTAPSSCYALHLGEATGIYAFCPTIAKKSSEFLIWTNRLTKYIDTNIDS